MSDCGHGRMVEAYNAYFNVVEISTVGSLSGHFRGMGRVFATPNSYGELRSGQRGKDLPNLFSPFSPPKRQRGTGLSRSISYALVERHGGHITE
ncbi:protein of unknown function [Cupriavidus taiwanensis]|nr:protein of unknown function [Cupriavidus taiwanensis]